MLCRASCETSYKNTSICSLSTNDRIYFYSGIIVFAVVMNFARALGFCYICVNASRILHNRMFRVILRAPVLFFDTNPIGMHTLRSVIHRISMVAKTFGAIYVLAITEMSLAQKDF